MVFTVLWVTASTPFIPVRICPRMLSISWVVCLLSSASFLISSATTAKPLPDSPALAASIAALSARRLVCSAIELIFPTTSPIFCDLTSTSFTASTVSLAWSLAWLILFTMVLMLPNPFFEASNTITEFSDRFCAKCETF
jgi:hypothetical protein